MSKNLTIGSCFSGIGGLELGLERTGGFETIWLEERNTLFSSLQKERLNLLWK